MSILDRFMIIIILLLCALIMISESKPQLLISPATPGQCTYGVFKYDGKGVRFLQSIQYSFEEKKAEKPQRKTTTINVPAGNMTTENATEMKDLK